MTLRHAIVGTDKSFFTPTDLAQIAQQYAINTHNKSKEALLLQIGAIQGVQNKAGFISATFNTPLPIAAPAETLPHIPPNVVARLTQLLVTSPEGGAIISELLNLIAQKGFCVNPSVLPYLLNWAKNRKELHPTIAQVIGERGRWLAQQNPEWDFVQHTQQPQTSLAIDWQTATLAQRLPYIIHLRQTQPQQATQLLQSTWHEENAEAAKAFLEPMSINLSANDEAFLVMISTDKRKTVRSLILDLLAQIPQSAYQTKLAAYVDTLINVSKSWLMPTKINLQLPTQINQQLQELGVEEKTKLVQGNERINWLAQLIVRLNPNYWAQKIGDIAQTLSAINKTDWANELTQAITLQAIFHKHDAWLTFLYSHWATQPNNETYCQNIASALSATAWQQAVTQCLGFADPLLYLSILINAQNLPLDAPQTQKIARLMGNKLLTHNTTNYYEATRYISLLEKIALHIAPSNLAALHHEIQLLLDKLKEQPDYLSRPLQKIVETLEMRHQINTLL